jgi:hypothetical protein
MVNIVKGIDIISHGDGKHYTSRMQLERSLESQGMYIKSDKECKQLIEKLNDIKHSKPKEYTEQHNHTHIDLRNMQATTSYKKGI